MDWLSWLFSGGGPGGVVQGPPSVPVGSIFPASPTFSGAASVDEGGFVDPAIARQAGIGSDYARSPYPALGQSLTPTGIPMPRPRPQETGAGAGEARAQAQGGREGLKQSGLLDALKGMSAIPAPKAQTVATPAAPRPTAIQSGEFINLLMSMGIGPRDLQRLRLGR